MAATQHLVGRAMEAALRAVRAGQKTLARQLLLKVTQLDPMQERAWLELSGVAESAEEAQACLKTVLALNPDNREAQEALQQVAQQQPAESRPTPPDHDLAPGDTARGPTAEHVQSPAAEVPGAAAEEEPPARPAGKPAGEKGPLSFLSVEQAEAVDRCLDKMVAKSQALCIILADATGQLIAERGHTRAMDTQAFSALVAGEMVATRELARLVGERARFRLLMNEGESQNVYLSDISEQMILVIVSRTDTTIGLVRMVLKQAVEELTPILARPSTAAAGTAEEEELLGGDFAQQLESELDDSLEL